MAISVSFCSLASILCSSARALTLHDLFFQTDNNTLVDGSETEKEMDDREDKTIKISLIRPWMKLKIAPTGFPLCIRRTEL